MPIKDIKNPTLEELEELLISQAKGVDYNRNRDGWALFHLCKMMIEHLKESKYEKIL